MTSSLPYLIRKEFKQMIRSRVLPIVFILLPLILMNMIPRVATQEVKGLKFCVIDNDRSMVSRLLIQKLDASTYLDLASICRNNDEACTELDDDNADIILEIPQYFERNLIRTGRDRMLHIADTELPALLISANATNGIKSGMGQQYIQQIIYAFAVEIIEEIGGDAVLGRAKVPSMRFMFNTRLDYRIYMTPCVFAFLLILIVGFLPALNIVGEKERGTIEQVNVTPIGKLEFILSKMIPYWCVGIVMSVIGLMAAYVFYGITPVGSLCLFFLFIFVFSILISSFGLIISNYSNTTQQAALTMFFFLIIFILLSGFVTPISSMQEWAQKITLLDPMRYLNESLRAIFIKGSTFSELYRQFYSLVIYAVITCTWSILSYKKNS